MPTVKVTPDAIAWPCPDCDGNGIVPEYLQEFYHGARAGRRGDDYCETCLTQGRCPVCGGEAMWDEENKCSKVCPECGHDVERVGRAVEREAFEKTTGSRRLSSAIDSGGRLILRYLVGSLFIEFKVFGDLLCYKRSYWRKQALTEAAQAMIEAFDTNSHRKLSPCFSEEMFEDMREVINDLDSLKPVAEIIMKAYDAMPYERPFGRDLNSSHFDRLRDALSAF